jgi:hypothetical protein
MLYFYIFGYGMVWDAGIRGTGLPSEVDRIGTPTWDAQGGRVGAGVTSTADYFQTLQQGPGPGIPGSGGAISFMACVLLDSNSADFHVWSGRHSAVGYSGPSLRSLNTGTSWRAQYGDGGGFSSTDRRSINSSIGTVTGRPVVVGAVLRGSTDMDLYIDGVRDAGATFDGTGGSISNGTNLPARFGGPGQNVNGMIGQFLWIAAWNRNLHHNEFMQFYLDPFRIIERPRIPISTLKPTVAVYTDSATIYVDIQAYVTEEYPVVPIDISTSGVEEKATEDAATIYIDIQNTGAECYSTAAAIDLGDGEATEEWYESVFIASMIATAEPEWSYGIVTLEEGC